MAIDPAVRPGVQTPCPVCAVKVLTRHCTGKNCDLAKCRGCGWMGQSVPPHRSRPPLPPGTVFPPKKEGPFHE